MKKVTLKQIAEMANTSIGTVDRALNNRGRINETTKERVLKIADELGYRPNKLASSLSRSKSLRVGILYPKFPTYFFDGMTLGVRQAVRGLTDYNIEVTSLRCDYLNPDSQIELMAGIEPEQFDGFILNAGGSKLLPYIDRLVEAGVPVATFNSDIRGSKRLFHVGVDPYLSGRLAGELMGKIMNGTGKVLALSGFYSVYAHTERIRGFTSVLKECYPDIRIVGEGEYLDSDQAAEELAAKLLEEHPDIGGIYTTSSPGAIGVGWYLEKHPLPTSPVLTGYDVTSQLSSLLKKGICSFIIYQNPSAQAYFSLNLMANYLMEGVIPSKKHLMLQPQVILKENVDSYLFSKDLSYQFLL